MTYDRHEPKSAYAMPPEVLSTEGNCRGADTEAFFPTTTKQLAYAIKICDSCHVRQTCFDWAMETGQAHGVYGGMGPEQRVKILKGAAA